MRDTQTVRWLSTLISTVGPDIPEMCTGRDDIVQHAPSETEIIK